MYRVDDLLRIILDIHPPWLLESLRDEKRRWRREDLRGYQVKLVDLIKRCFGTGLDKLPGALLALEPGAGKTGTVLTAIRDLLDERKVKKVLIVASVLVAQTVWPDEIDEWEHVKDTTWTLLRVEDDDPETTAAGLAAYEAALAEHQQRFDDDVATKVAGGMKRGAARNAVRSEWQAKAEALQTLAEKDRGWKPKSTPAALAEEARNAAVLAAKEAKLQQLASEDTEIHIINKEALLWLWNHFGDGRNWPYDMIVTDDLREGRSGKKRTIRGKDKNDTTGKGKAPLSRFGVLAKARKKVKATIEMTGTPTPKGLENMWGLIYLLDLGQRLGGSKTAFLQRWFTVNEYSRKTTPRAHAFREIMDLVKDIMFSLDPADLPELPEYVMNPIKVRLPADVLAAYKTFKRNMVSEEYDVEAVNGGVLHGKLLQFANGSMYQEDGNDVAIHDVKIDALRELLMQLDGTPLLVAYTYQFDVERICRAFNYAVVLTPENSRQVVRDWNADKIPLLLAHRASAAHGLNMQKGTGHMCEYGLTSDAELFEQFRKRIHRSGRKTKVFMHVIMAEGTIDEEIYPIYLDPKIAVQNQILAETYLKWKSA